jgi:hypothetical protein
MFVFNTISTQPRPHVATNEASLRSASVLRGLELGSVYGELAGASSNGWAMEAQVRGKVSDRVSIPSVTRLDGGLFGNDDQLPCPDVDTKPDRFGLRRLYKRLV